MKKHLRNLILTTIAASSLCVPLVWAENVSLEKAEVDYNGKQFAEFLYVPTKDKESAFDQNNLPNWILFADGELADYKVTDDTKLAVQKAGKYWVDILGANNKKSDTLWKIVVNSSVAPNAFAASTAVIMNCDSPDLGNSDEILLQNSNIIAEFMQDGATSIDLYGNSKDLHAGDKLFASFIFVGKYMGVNKTIDGKADYGWRYNSTPSVLPKNGQGADLNSIMIHELGHALGISVRTQALNIHGENAEVYDSTGKPFLQ